MTLHLVVVAWTLWEFRLGFTKEKEQKSEEKQTVFDNPDNTEVLLKKEDREEYYFVPTAKKKGKSKQHGWYPICLNRLANNGFLLTAVCNVGKPNSRQKRT